EADREGRLEGVVLRLGNTYGPGARLDSMVADLRVGHLAVEHRTGAGVPWVHLDEAAEAFVAAVEKDQARGVYNIVEDESMSFGAFIRCLADATGAPPPRSVPNGVLEIVAPYLKASEIDAHLLLSNRKAKAGLAWEPRFASPREGLAASVPAIDPRAAR